MNITQRKPTHPGVMLLETVIKPLGLSVSEAAKELGVSRKMLSQFVHGHTGLSPEMAVRIGLATKMSAERWLALQTRLDLWEAEQNRPKSIKPFKGLSELTAV